MKTIITLVGLGLMGLTVLWALLFVLYNYLMEKHMKKIGKQTCGFCKKLIGEENERAIYMEKHWFCCYRHYHFFRETHDERKKRDETL